VPQALTEGFRLAYLICAGLAGAAALVAFVALPRSGTAMGATARRLAAAIAVLVVGFVAADLAFANSRGAPVGAYVTDGSYSFVTAPSLRPPIITTDQPATPAHSHPASSRHKLLRPQLSADGRPERSADPRRQPAAGLFSPCQRASSRPT